MSYKKLDIWIRAKELTIEIHHMTIEKLPNFELYEVGSQIRRSMKSVRSNIVEGYGRRRYKQDYIRFMVYSQSSNDEIAMRTTFTQTGNDYFMAYSMWPI